MYNGSERAGKKRQQRQGRAKKMNFISYKANPSEEFVCLPLPLHSNKTSTNYTLSNDNCGTLCPTISW